MYSLSYILLLAFIVCLADHGKCKPSALVGIFAESLAPVPPADSPRYAEKRPAIHRRQSPGGPHHNWGFHAYHHGSPGTTRTTSASLSRQRRGPPSYFSRVYTMWRVPLAAVMALIVFTALRKRCLSRADSAPASTQSGAPSRRLTRERRDKEGWDIELVCMGLWRPADAEEADVLLPGAASVAVANDFRVDMHETGGLLWQGDFFGGGQNLGAGRNIGPLSSKEDIPKAVVVFSGLAAACFLWVLVEMTYILLAKSGIPVGSNLPSNTTDGPLAGGHAASLGTPSTPTPVGGGPASWPTTGISAGPGSPPGITPSMILPSSPVRAAVDGLRHMRTCQARERRSSFR